MQLFQIKINRAQFRGFKATSRTSAFTVIRATTSPLRTATSVTGVFDCTNEDYAIVFDPNQEVGEEQTITDR
jgi:hypothetical protein